MRATTSRRLGKELRRSNRIKQPNMGSPRPTALVEVPGSPVENDDAALVRRSRAGDEDSFATLYRRYRPAVFEVCRRRLRDPIAADDVTQDTFMRAYSNLHLFDDERRLLPWLIAIATRRCIDVIRRDSRTCTSGSLVEVDVARGEDPTLDAVLANEERRRLERGLKRLAPRQRRALLLHAIEGWSYADIASAEGVSVASTKSLLFHARQNLRLACRRGLLALFVLPTDAVRRRLRELALPIRTRVHSAVEPAANSVGGVLASSVSAMVMAIVALVPQTDGHLTTLPTAHRTPTTLAALVDLGAGGAASRSASPARRSPRDASLTGALLDPTKGATPEDTQLTSVAASPNYERDRTLVAAGRVPCQRGSCMVLFSSRDGGASWSRIASKDFNGHTVLLPPSYPADPRIFAMGESGLQVSRDGGNTFDEVLPVQGDIAISPQFDDEDPRILIGASVVTEYWPNRELVKPAALVGPVGTWLTVAFSPAYARDGIVFVGGIRPDSSGVMRPTVNRCAGSVCENVIFEEGFDAPWLRTSQGFARDGTVYAFTSKVLFRSVDGGRTFVSSNPAFGASSSIRDLFVPDGSGVVAAVQRAGRAGSGGGVYRSSDGGITWSGGHVRVAGFEAGASRIIGLPGGRMIALGADSGIACSADGGRTWSERCAA
jgi:RNA polymerase sigma factor (sigma-70 family)